MPSPITIATRGSALALAQANAVLAQCREAFPDQAFEIKVIKTTGDKLPTASLTSPGLFKGFFTKELEVALLNGEADLAVHSLKDLPTELPAGLKLGAVSRRADARDVLIYRDIEYLVCHQNLAKPVEVNKRGFKSALSLRGLPHGATLGTSSTRRSSLAREARPDLQFVPLRGNVGTRLQKLAQQPELDALILALAGLERLGFRLSPDGSLRGEGVPPGLAATPLGLGEMLPCVGQAALGIEIRQGDARLERICEPLDHAETHRCVTAERAFLRAMGGGCHLAVAAYAEICDGRLRLRGVSFLGPEARRAEERGDVSEAAEMGKRMAEQLQSDNKGASPLLSPKP
jgi:hydroxymethylbilane synthase